ncbi:P1 family peptidase [Streptomyces sp. 796.1]|uniref:P1 family peptidase n=1 Tax=Streptomyces sp. 796.1 TaxID=3163029 RepID=UPI0039C9422F
MADADEATGQKGRYALAPAPRPGPRNALTDVAGLRVGHAQRCGSGWLTGTTVVLAPEGGAVAAVDVRGGGPGTRETDALDPRNLVQRVEAVVLTGGSAFGLDAASGVLAWLEDQGRGFRVGPDPRQVVPVVPAAALFDLGRGGDWRARPDAALGREAAAVAADDGAGGAARGNVGAGAGAVAGGVKGGVGTASSVLPSGITVAALAIVNAAGSTIDPHTGRLYGTLYGRPYEDHHRPYEEHQVRAEQQERHGPQGPRDTGAGVGSAVGVGVGVGSGEAGSGGVGSGSRQGASHEQGRAVEAGGEEAGRERAERGRFYEPVSPGRHDEAQRRLRLAREESERRQATSVAPPLNTTLAIVATDADLTRAQAQKLAGTAHDGLARAIRPVHLLSDGDTVFALATGGHSLDAAAAPATAGLPNTAAFGVHRAAGALNEVLAAGADVLMQAVVDAMLSAESIDGPGGVFPSYRELYEPGRQTER